MENIKNARASVVPETEYGVYVWKLDDGSYLSDGDDRVLSINSRADDLLRMSKLQTVVRSYGIQEGRPHYLPDQYKVTDGEYESMRERLDSGWIPDPASRGNWSEDI